MPYCPLYFMRICSLRVTPAALRSYVQATIRFLIPRTSAKEVAVKELSPFLTLAIVTGGLVNALAPGRARPATASGASCTGGGLVLPTLGGTKWRVFENSLAAEPQGDGFRITARVTNLLNWAQSNGTATVEIREGQTARPVRAAGEDRHCHAHLERDHLRGLGEQERARPA